MFKIEASILLFTMALFAFPLQAQEQKIDLVDHSPRVKNVIYMEFLGHGIIYSINYERRIAEKFWLKTGGSYGSGTLFFGKMAAMPVGISYLIGEEKGYLELGAGATFLYWDAEGYFFDSKWSGILPNSTIAIRYQPDFSTVFMKLAFTPFIKFSSAPEVFPFGGLSLGYSF